MSPYSRPVLFQAHQMGNLCLGPNLIGVKILITSAPCGDQTQAGGSENRLPCHHKANLYSQSMQVLII